MRLANNFIQHAITQNASHIHIEPSEKGLEVRYRVDGQLRPYCTAPRYIQLPLTARYKEVAGLNIPERTRPQGGHFDLSYIGRPFRIHVSTLPMQYGEKLVLRIYDHTMPEKVLGALGLSSEGQKALQEMTASRYGVTQVYVGEKGGQCLVDVLRSLREQDADHVVMGESDDAETACEALEAARHHRTVTTLRSQDACYAPARFTDLCGDRNLPASTVLGVVYQRLGRTICPQCKETYEENARSLQGFGFEPQSPDQTLLLARGRGCEACHETGYAGRTGFFEILPMNAAIADLFSHRASPAELQALTAQLREEALRKVLDHATTVEEVQRVCFGRVA